MLLLTACCSPRTRARRARTLDLARAGAIAGRLTTGAGVDNIDYDRTARQLLVASGKDAKLVIAQVDVLLTRRRR